MAPLLVMLPGLNNTGAVFDGVVAALGSAVRVRVPDLPALETVEDIARQILAELSEPFLLCGFSFGGYVAMAMLELAPERIIGLALIGSGPAADPPARHDARQAAINKALSGDYVGMVRAQAAAAFHPDSLKNSALMATREIMVAEYGAERFVAHSRASLARPDRFQTLQLLRKPLLIVAGDHDALCPPAYREKTAKAAPAAQIVVIERAGHLAPLEQPVEVAAALRAWIAG